jgi:ABC-type metal ion transport system substrate-binding protein
MRKAARSWILAALAAAICAGCGSDSTEPVKVPFGVSLTADSASAKGAVVGNSYQCGMTLTMKVTGQAADTAAFTSGTLVITPIGSAAQITDLSVDLVAAMFGTYNIAAGRTLTTRQVFAAVNSKSPYTAALTVRYEFKGVITALPPATFNCT